MIMTIPDNKSQKHSDFFINCERAFEFWSLSYDSILESKAAQILVTIPPMYSIILVRFKL
jgi:hypothetical protein